MTSPSSQIPTLSPSPSPTSSITSPSSQIPTSSSVQSSSSPVPAPSSSTLSTKYKFNTENNKNCIWDRVPKVYASNDNYNYIGTFNSYDECEKAALADPNINKIKAVSWHNDNYGDWKGVCYTINDNNTNHTDPNSTCGIKQTLNQDNFVENDFVVYTTSTSDLKNSPINDTLENCIKICDNNPECVGFSREKSKKDSDKGECYLKKDIINNTKTYNDPTWKTYTKLPTPIVTNFDAPLGEYSSCCNEGCTDAVSNCNCMMYFKVIYRKTINGMYYDSLPSITMGPSKNCNTYWNPTLYFKIINPPNPSDNISIVLLTSKNENSNWYYSDVSPISLTDAINNDKLNQTLTKKIPKFSGTTATFASKYIQNKLPVPIIIPKFIIRAGGSNWAKLIQNGDETTTSIQLSWNPDIQSNNLDYAKVNQIGVQFRYFAQYWLNKTGKSSASTDVYVGSLSNNIGKYEFSVNGTTYTGKFYGQSWSWNYSGEYCFTTENAQIKDTCMNGWEYQNGMCYASGNANGSASTKCSAYSWPGMSDYSQPAMNDWVSGCSVGNSQNCKNSSVYKTYSNLDQNGQTIKQYDNKNNECQLDCTYDNNCAGYITNTNGSCWTVKGFPSVYKNAASTINIKLPRPSPSLPTPIITNFDHPLGEYSSACTGDISKCNCMMEFKIIYRTIINGIQYDSLPSNTGSTNNCFSYWNPTLYFKISNPPNPSDNISVVLLTSRSGENNWHYSAVPPINLKDTIINDILNKRIPKFSGATATFGPKYIQNTSPVPIIIPKFIIRSGGSNWAKLIQDGDETTTSIQLSWNPDIQSNDLNYAKDNQIGVQFRYFAQYWLSKTDKKSGSTDVYVGSLSNNLGKYEFSVDGTSYTGKFNGKTWPWNYDGDYCFTENNAKIKNTCMNGWEYQKDMCYASGNANGSASTKCSPYSWPGMATYTGSKTTGSLGEWISKCGVNDTPNCKNSPQPRIWFVEWNGEPGLVIIKLGEIQQALHLNIRKDITVMNSLNENNQWGQEDRSITDFHFMKGWSRLIKNPLSFYIIFMADGFNIIYNEKVIAKFPNRFNVTNSNNLNIFQDKGIKVTEIS